jgi:hypothetical protein
MKSLIGNIKPVFNAAVDSKLKNDIINRLQKMNIDINSK